MAQKQGIFWSKIVPAAYSVGAAIVVLGAWAKITHQEGLGFLLTVGLIVEAIIFLLYAVQTFLFNEGGEYQWERVYPELMDDSAVPVVSKKENKGVGLTANMDKMMAEANITPDIFNNLGKGFKSLTDTVSKIGDITDATVATKEYSTNVKQAAGAITEMNKSYGTAITAMTSMADATKDAQAYRDQFTQVTKNMGALNAVYELELQDTTKHLKAMNAFYGNLSTAMANMADATKESQQFKTEMSKLTGNISSLNNVYGNMLSAMRGGN
ncbi:MAG: gliding motility protein GldL [Runella slithyformis]|nr:MAG: gliding motility protein GldL [Runella slithyformis]TAF29443.1 MAG: gliding motility protein GldL [Runella slithyformis]TAF48192.1 MAG: gliding motility protein GldL [Runella slithyformis]TAF81648.1 MAG: gliding motility protein GldL [Runella slithyformis]